MLHGSAMESQSHRIVLLEQVLGVSLLMLIIVSTLRILSTAVSMFGSKDRPHQDIIIVRRAFRQAFSQAETIRFSLTMVS